MKKLLFAFLIGKLIEKIYDDGTKDRGEELIPLTNIFFVGIIKNLPFF